MMQVFKLFEFVFDVGCTVALCKCFAAETLIEQTRVSKMENQSNENARLK